MNRHGAPGAFAVLVDRIEAALRQPLPGQTAQMRMAPLAPRDWPPGFNPARARRAAGLLLLVPRGDRPHVVLTVRSDSLGRHGGQVSLPGGVVEPGESFEQAALREAHEEVGLSVQQVRTLGALTPVDIVVSGFRLHPVVAAADAPVTLTPTDGEVARILEVALADLREPDRVVWRGLTRDGRTVRYPAFLVEGVEVWGATAMVLAEFLAVAGWAGPPPE